MNKNQEADKSPPREFWIRRQSLEQDLFIAVDAHKSGFTENGFEQIKAIEIDAYLAVKQELDEAKVKTFTLRQELDEAKALLKSRDEQIKELENLIKEFRGWTLGYIHEEIDKYFERGSGQATE